MEIEQNKWTEVNGWEPQRLGKLRDAAQLVLVFGSTSILKDKKYFNEVKKAYPKAHLLGCSTAGEICGTQVSDESLVVTAMRFESTQLKGARVRMSEVENSCQ